MTEKQIIDLVTKITQEGSKGSIDTSLVVLIALAVIVAVRLDFIIKVGKQLFGKGEIITLNGLHAQIDQLSGDNSNRDNSVIQSLLSKVDNLMARIDDLTDTKCPGTCPVLIQEVKSTVESVRDTVHSTAGDVHKKLDSIVDKISDIVSKLSAIEQLQRSTERLIADILKLEESIPPTIVDLAKEIQALSKQGIEAAGIQTLVADRLQNLKSELNDIERQLSGLRNSSS